jgi:hypothetical protein
MKKIAVISILCVCSVLAFVSCSSTKVDTVSPDQYGTEVTPISPSSAPAGTSKDEEEKSAIVVPQQGNAFTRFFTGSQKDIEMDKTKIFQLTVVNTLKQEDATVIYNIKSEKAGFSAWYQTNWYHLLFDTAARRGLAAASTQYLSDFEGKNLDRKNRKSYKAYGEYPVMLRWGTIPGMESGYASTNVQFGYEFNKSSPYFTMTVWQVPNEAYTDNSSEVPTSSTLHFYMTKGQIVQMTEMLSDDKIMEVLKPYMQNAEENKNPQTDAY